MTDILPAVEERLDELAERKNRDADVVYEAFEEELTGIQDGPADFPEELAQKNAYRKVKSKIIRKDSVGGGETVYAIAIGNSGVMPWPVRDDNGNRTGDRKDVIVGHAVVKPENGRPGLSVLICDETNGVDLPVVRRLFRPGKVVSGVFRVDESETLSDGYVCWSFEDTEVEEADPADIDGIPEDVDERMNIVNQLTDTVTLAELANEGREYFSAYDVTEDGMQSKEWGIDIKRVPMATVVTTFANEEEGYGFYTILDDSVIDEEELEGTALDGDNQSTAGLSLRADPYMMEYGNGTIGDFFGVVTERQEDKHIQMDLRGIHPVDPEPRDTSGDDSESIGETETDTF